ncbi:MAG: hypothetical protein PHG02_10295, partial [Oscillospiraceae bacterium]|nr:hypothetical protein [Oscillospiraceae bacterium]
MALTVTPLINTTFYLLQKSGAQIEERALWQLQKIAQEPTFQAAQLRQLPQDAVLPINPITLECDILESAVVIVEQSWFMRVGGLDERLPEEQQLWDLSLRLQGAKAKMVYLPYITVGYPKTEEIYTAQLSFKQQRANLCMACKYGANIDILRAWLLFKESCAGQRKNPWNEQLKILPQLVSLWIWRFSSAVLK